MESSDGACRGSSAAASCVASAFATVGPSSFDKSGSTVYLKDMVSLVLENKPTDPVEFVSDYLRGVLRGSSPVSRAYQYVRLAPHHRRAFHDNCVVAHAGLSQANGSRDTADLETHLLLLEKLCSDLGDETVAATVLDALGRGTTQTRRTGESLLFEEFVTSVRGVLAFEELLLELRDALGMDDLISQDFKNTSPKALRVSREAVLETARKLGHDERAEAFREAVMLAIGKVSNGNDTFPNIRGATVPRDGAGEGDLIRSDEKSKRFLS